MNPMMDPSNTGSGTIYQATPLEQAYSLYLGQNVFALAPNMPVHISGRSAVPFLTQSGVDRGTLRSIWTATDPDNIGTLTQWSQFQLLLRLVSLAQAGILNAQGTPQEMRASVQQSSTQALALPFFQSVTIPPHNNLISMYQNSIVFPQGGTPGPSGFGMPQVSMGTTTTVGTFGTATTATVSIDDAFSDMVPSVDAPLPSLAGSGESNSESFPPSGVGESEVQPPPVPAGQPDIMDPSTAIIGGGVAPADAGANDDFGDFTDVAAAPALSNPMVNDGLSAMDPLQQQQQQMPSQNIGFLDSTADDDFGDFTNVSAPAPSLTTDAFTGMNPPVETPHQATAPTLGISDAFGDLTGVQDAPLPALSDSVPPITAQEDDFGGFEAAPAAGVPNTPPATLSEPYPPNETSNDDFGGFEEAPTTGALDAPLPAIAGGVPASGTGDEDFGGFETAPTVGHTPTSAGIDSSATPTVDVFGSFGQNASSIPAPDTVGSFMDAGPVPASGSGLSTTSASISDAFGSMDIPDVPLPSLDQLASTSQEEQITQTMETPKQAEMSDDFGGFSEASPAVDTTSMAAGPSDEDPFAGMPSTVDKALPSSGTPAQPTSPGDDDFGGFEEAQTSTVPAVSASLSFEGNTSASPSGLGDLTTTTSNANMPVPIEDAFGGLTVDDAPLSSLDSLVPSAPNIVSDTDGAGIGIVDSNDDDDDFGGFEEAAPIQPASLDPVGSLDDPFAVISKTDDKPLPALQNATEGTEAGDLIGIQDAQMTTSTSIDSPGIPAALSFGGGSTSSAGASGLREVSALTLGSGLATTTNELPTDPFAAMDQGPSTPGTSNPIPETPDPNLTSATVPPSDDLFGAFESTAPEPNESPSGANDGFGAFESSSSQDNATSGAQKAEDDFGDFDSAPVLQTDVPPPSDLEQNPSAEGTDDLFGAFDSAPTSTVLSQNQDISAPPAADSFSAFDSAPVQEAVSMTATGNEAFGSFDSATVEPKSDVTSTDPFGAFDSVPTPTISAKQSTEDLFGAPIAVPSETPDVFDSASSEQQGGAQVDNSFGLFDTAPTVTMTPPQEDFGDFGSAPSSQVDPAVSATSDDFGAFDTAPAVQEGIPPPSVDAFGEFDAASPLEKPIDSTPDVDEFGAFDTTPAVQEGIPPPSGDGFGEFDAASPLEKPIDSTTGDDEFGAFDNAPFQAGDTDNIDDFGAFNTTASEAKIGAAIDDFGAFDSAPSESKELAGPGQIESEAFGAFGESTNQATVVQVPPATMGGNTQNLPETPKDGFGSFAEAFPVAPAATGADDEWGNFDSAQERENISDDDFGAFDSAASNAGSKQPSSNASDGWGAFEESEASGAINVLQEKIRGLAMPLSENLLCKSGPSGEHVDLGQCYEVNIGLESTMDAVKKKRVERCMQILQILTKMDHTNGSTYWGQVVDVVKEEMKTCGTIMSEAREITLPSDSDALKPLQVMIAGLREYVRVLRFIVASIGDLLLLDPSAILTVDTWTSTWCNLAILEGVLEIESIWKQILKDAYAIFPSLGGSTDAPSVAEIRGLVCDSPTAENMCGLTLQPLVHQGKTPTTTPVSWSGKEFMACSANLLANRCPFFVVCN